MNIDLVREYWWVLPILVGVALLAFLLLRPRQSVRLSDSAPVRPHMAVAPDKHEHQGVADAAVAAAADLTSTIIESPGNDASATPPHEAGDDLVMLKGVGPKLADALYRLGFHRFEQIAGLSATEVERLDEQLGAFRGRLTRDRIVEQAAYLARGDRDGFEQRFGKL
jgi:predicted flap endonuclease-1-like 5' DNA nuclease